MWDSFIQTSSFIVVTSQPFSLAALVPVLDLEPATLISTGLSLDLVPANNYGRGRHGKISEATLVNKQQQRDALILEVNSKKEVEQ